MEAAGLSHEGRTMKPVSTPTAPTRVSLKRRGSEEWRDRSARLYEELARPARAMVRRAFRGAFCADEIDDIYSGAWAGILRALERRHSQMSDDELRSYVFTAVANQAGKEIRRRGRKPTAPLEVAASAPDAGIGPEEVAVASEASRVARDVLTSLPPRRRAVMLLRYGWGLDPSQVCGLVDGLSPRAYRKEVTRGVDEVTERMRAVESGEWCGEREPVLKALAAGVADSDQELQAQAHLAHCRGCSDFVAKLNGHLHDLGGAALPGAIEGLDGHSALADRFLDLGLRAREIAANAFARGSSTAGEATTGLASAGGARGAGAAGAGVFAKLAGIGTAGKLALACVGGGAAATACVAAGVAPFGLAPDGPRPAEAPAAEVREVAEVELQAAAPALSLNLDSQPGAADANGQPSHQGEGGSGEGVTEQSVPSPAPAPQPDPVATSAPPVEQEFGVAAAAAPAPSPSSGSSTGSGGGSSGSSVVRQEFGP